MNQDWDLLKATQESLLVHQNLLERANERINELYEDRDVLEAEIEKWRLARCQR